MRTGSSSEKKAIASEKRARPARVLAVAQQTVWHITRTSRPAGPPIDQSAGRAGWMLIKTLKRVRAASLEIAGQRYARACTCAWTSAPGFGVSRARLAGFRRPGDQASNTRRLSWAALCRPSQSRLLNGLERTRQAGGKRATRADGINGPESQPLLWIGGGRNSIVQSSAGARVLTSAK